MKILFSLLAMTVLIIFVSACAPRELSANGQNVYLLNNLPPRTCRLIGYIKNANVHKDLDLRYTEKDKQKDYINYVRNESAKLGANAVAITSIKKFDIKRYYVKSSSYFIVQGNDITANAYLCPANVMISISKY